ncbi:hypothetical protein FCV25MIE_33820, partial [Fagus crenata]
MSHYQTQNYNKGSNSGVPNDVVPQNEGRPSLTYNPSIVKGTHVQCNGFMTGWSTGSTFNINNVANNGNNPGKNYHDEENESQIGGGFNPAMANVPMGQFDWLPPQQATCGNTFDIPIQADVSGNPLGPSSVYRQMDPHFQAQVQQGHTTATISNPVLDGSNQDGMDDIEMMAHLHNAVFDDTQFHH